ncbi:MAG: hypothetical protein KGH75_14370, partial [Rhodospirillales bacterium]|nr:hypothetical protein [Rhodospirillales bacterium]
ADDAAIDAECDALFADPDRLLEAVCDDSVNDAEKLAELLIVLHAASHALNRLFHGDSFDEATSYAGNLDAMRALARAADAAHKQVEQRIKFAAETEVGARK